MPKLEKEKFNFTEAYQELEKLNDWFQREDIDLDEGLKKYRRGLELIKKCRERLKAAENQFIEIKKEFFIKELKEGSASKRTKNGNNSDEEDDVKDIPF